MQIIFIINVILAFVVSNFLSGQEMELVVRPDPTSGCVSVKIEKAQHDEQEIEINSLKELDELVRSMDNTKKINGRERRTYYGMTSQAWHEFFTKERKLSGDYSNAFDRMKWRRTKYFHVLEKEVIDCYLLRIQCNREEDAQKKKNLEEMVDKPMDELMVKLEKLMLECDEEKIGDLERSIPRHRRNSICTSIFMILAIVGFGSGFVVTGCAELC